MTEGTLRGHLDRNKGFSFKIYVDTLNALRTHDRLVSSVTIGFQRRHDVHSSDSSHDPPQQCKSLSHHATRYQSVYSLNRHYKSCVFYALMSGIEGKTSSSGAYFTVVICELDDYF